MSFNSIYPVSYTEDEMEMMSARGFDSKLVELLPLNRMFGRWMLASAVNKSAKRAYGTQFKNAGPMGWVLFRNAKFSSIDERGLHFTKGNSTFILSENEALGGYRVESFSSSLYQRGIDTYGLSEIEAMALATRVYEIDYIEAEVETIADTVNIIPDAQASVVDGVYGIQWADTIINSQSFASRPTKVQVMVYNGASRKDMVASFNVKSDKSNGGIVLPAELGLDPSAKYLFAKVKIRVAYKKWASVNINLK